MPVAVPRRCAAPARARASMLRGPSRHAARATEVARGRSTAVHRLLDGSGGPLVVPGVFDALSAKAAQKAGFPAVFVSGYALSASLLGEPDVGLLTPPEMAGQCRNICEAVRQYGREMLVIADADTGGGGALNIRRTIRDLISAGASGCILEDQQWPKKCGHTLRGKSVIPVDEFATKIRAARDAADECGGDFFIIARTDARATSAKKGLEEAVSRVNEYMRAGADASFVEAPRSTDEIAKIGAETVGPRVANMIESSFTPDHAPDELMGMGFQIVLRPLTGLMAAEKALDNAYNHLRAQGTMKDKEYLLAKYDDIRETLDLAEVYQIEDKYITPADEMPKTMDMGTRVGQSYPAKPREPAAAAEGK